MSTYPQKTRDLITKLRKRNPGWGALNIRLELEVKYKCNKEHLPSTDGIHRYLKEQGLIPERIPRSTLPESKPSKVKDFHDLWEMDAQGAEKVSDLGHIAMINIKDSKSKVYVSSFPTLVGSAKTKPKTDHYLWAMRFGFEQFGLPKAIQVDRDTAFVDSKPTSPFPSLIHLFLIGLDIDLQFIKVPPPNKQAMVERSHQTMERQVLRGKSYTCWHDLLVNTNYRRKMMNEYFPSRSLNKQAPLQAFPAAAHSNRTYRLAEEEQLLSINRIEKYLASCTWYRKTAKNKVISLHGKPYYLNQAESSVYLKIQFDPKRQKLIFRNDKELVVQEVEVKDFVRKLLKQPPVNELLKTKEKILNQSDFIL